MVQSWSEIPIFLSLDSVVVGLGVDNLIQVLMQALMHQGGLIKNLIGIKFMTFGANGVSVFQGIKLGVTRQIFDARAPHSIGVHCMAHRTNLAVQILSHLQMVNRFEGLFHTLYNYFSKSPKRHLEFTKLVKILRNVKTRWISMLSLVQCVMVRVQNFSD